MLRGRFILSGGSVYIYDSLGGTRIYALAPEIVGNHTSLSVQFGEGPVTVEFLSLVEGGIYNYGISKSSTDGTSVFVDGSTEVDATKLADIDITTLVLGSRSNSTDTMKGVTDFTINTDMTQENWYKETDWSQP
jgi:hypothetical protein